MIIPSIGIGPLGTSEWSIPGISGIGPDSPVSIGGATGVTEATNGSSPSFGNVLTNAIGSLENSQATASSTAEQLATGKLSDPTTAVNAAENATLAMDFASQLRNGIDTDVTTLMQTPV